MKSTHADCNVQHGARCRGRNHSESDGDGARRGSQVATRAALHIATAAGASRGVQQSKSHEVEEVSEPHVEEAERVDIVR